jgi:aminomuconate-semialdehyde/2-hydroxymuconate-6-semialdehyde dehydrogenase
MRTILNFIDGEARESSSGRTLDNFEPATGEVYSQVADSNADDIHAAYLAARDAFPAWS